MPLSSASPAGVAASLAFRPSAVRVLNRALWEASRLALPVLPVMLLAYWATQLPALERVGEGLHHVGLAGHLGEALWPVLPGYDLIGHG